MTSTIRYNNKIIGERKWYNYISNDQFQFTFFTMYIDYCKFRCESNHVSRYHNNVLHPNQR